MRRSSWMIVLCLAALVVPVGLVGAADVDLSPAKWGDCELDYYMRLNNQFGYQNMLASGADGVIVGTTGAPAERAGLEALKQGGSAVDAVLTTSLTQISLAMGSWVSYAGIITMVYYDAATGTFHNMNAGYNTVLGETDPMSIPAQTNVLAPTGNETLHPSGRTALVPGYMAGVQAAHDKFGKLPFAALFGPAIYFADHGFELTSLNASMIDRRKNVLSRLPATRKVFTKADGSWYREGDWFTQPEVADTLRKVAERGASYMYTGDWARHLVAAVQADGGKMTAHDLADYRVIWPEPIKVSYAGYDIYTHGLPAQGGAHVAEALNVASQAGLAGMGHYSESPRAFFWLSQITDLFAVSFLPRQTQEMMMGAAGASLEARTTVEHAKLLWAMMAAGTFPMAKLPATDEPRHSDAVVAIDRWGNVAAIVHTINTSSWGETGIMVDGVSIPDSAAFQQLLISETGPGKRLPDPTEPLIVARDGKPVAALSSIGAGLHQKTISVIMNLLDFGMGLKGSIDEPSMHLPEFSPDGSRIAQVFAGDFCNHLLDGVRELGLEVKVVPNDIQSRAPRGYVVGAAVDGDGRREAVATDTLNGRALGY